MKKLIKKLLRLYVMTHLRHDEEYYKKGLLSLGANIAELSHEQIAAYKAAYKVTEADMIIYFAFSSDVVKIEEEELVKLNDALIKKK